MGYAYAATLGEGETFTTIELKINFLRAVRKATVTAEARVVRAGSTVGYVECDVQDQTGRLIAGTASTCMKLKLESKSGTSTGVPKYEAWIGVSDFPSKSAGTGLTSLKGQRRAF